MKRLMLMAAALTLSGAAIAQDATTTDTTGSDMSQQSPPATTPDPANAAPDATTQPMQNDPAMTQPMQNDGNMSTTTAPASNMSNAGMMRPQAATGDYPPCSRTVTDRCTQTGKRAVMRPRRR